MLGAIRFVLAFFVLISHFSYNGMKMNLGVISVICFYFISGFLMSKSYARFVKLSRRPVFDFYIDRIIKLFPQYLLIVLATFGCIFFLGNSEAAPLLNQKIGFWKVMGNVTLLPANYVFSPFSIKALLPHPIVHPAWSLSTEFHFYLLLSLIFLLSKRYFVILVSITAAIQFTSFFFSTGAFNSNNFGYRFIFGVLTVFLYGFSFERNHILIHRMIAAVIWFMFAFFLLIIYPAFNVWGELLVQETLIGGFIALPLGYYFRMVKIESRAAKRIDGFLGDLAYPMFISHFLSFYLIEKILNIPISNRVAFYFAAIALCISILMILDWIQTHIEVYRLKRRGFGSLKDNNSIA